MGRQAVCVEEQEKASKLDTAAERKREKKKTKKEGRKEGARRREKEGEEGKCTGGAGEPVAVRKLVAVAKGVVLVAEVRAHGGSGEDEGNEQQGHGCALVLAAEANEGKDAEDASEDEAGGGNVFLSRRLGLDVLGDVNLADARAVCGCDVVVGG